jgi:cation diffusion facilitator CzcD-associated flavoprotein CzcO
VSAPVLVVGAGPAGLATSACLRHAGVAHTVIEQADSVASTWRGHYDRLHLHTAKQYSGLPFAPWPASAPRYPSRDEVVAYLQAYAQAHQVQPRFGVSLQQVQRSGTGLVAHTSAGPLPARAVVLATGYNRVPVMPQLPGLDDFGGPFCHASLYRNPEPYQGLRTLVVGCGNSGAEIALDLAEHGVDVAMVVRGPVHVAPRDLFGRPTQGTNILLSHLPLGLRDAIAGLSLRLAVGDLRRWGIERPALGPNAMIEQQGRIPLLDIGTIAMVKAGRIAVRPGVRALHPGAVAFADGRTEPFGAIVWATGYTTGLHALVDGFAALADHRGRPHRFGEETAMPGLYFVGFKNPPTGALREMALEARRVAAALAALA